MANSELDQIRQHIFHGDFINLKAFIYRCQSEISEDVSHYIYSCNSHTEDDLDNKIIESLDTIANEQYCHKMNFLPSELSIIRHGYTTSQHHLWAHKRNWTMPDTISFIHELLNNIKSLSDTDTIKQINATIDSLKSNLTPKSIKKILMLSSVFVNDIVPMLTSFDTPLESLDNITAVDFFISSEYLNCFKSSELIRWHDNSYNKKKCKFLSQIIKIKIPQRMPLFVTSSTDYKKLLWNFEHDRDYFNYYRLHKRYIPLIWSDDRLMLKSPNLQYQQLKALTQLLITSDEEYSTFVTIAQRLLDRHTRIYIAQKLSHVLVGHEDRKQITSKIQQLLENDVFSSTEIQLLSIDYHLCDVLSNLPNHNPKINLPAKGYSAKGLIDGIYDIAHAVKSLVSIVYVWLSYVLEKLGIGDIMCIDTSSIKDGIGANAPYNTKSNSQKVTDLEHDLEAGSSNTYDAEHAQRANEQFHMSIEDIDHSIVNIHKKQTEQCEQLTKIETDMHDLEKKVEELHKDVTLTARELRAEWLNKIAGKQNKLKKANTNEIITREHVNDSSGFVYKSYLFDHNDMDISSASPTLKTMLDEHSLWSRYIKVNTCDAKVICPDNYEDNIINSRYTK